MEKTSLLSDNIYYADQIGSIEDQKAFLDSFSDLLEPHLVFSPETMSQSLLFTAVKVTDNNKISSYQIRLEAGKQHRLFSMYPYTLDIIGYLFDRGYETHYFLSFFQKILCAEDHSEAVDDTAAAEDAASACPTVASECGN